MKFFCEYCGNRIDAEKDNKCPNCSASYKKNKSFIKMEEELKKEKQLYNENRQKIFNHVLSTFKFSRWFLLIPIFIFIIIFVVVISIINETRKNMNSETGFGENGIIEEVEDFYQNMIKEEDEQEITVNYNEFAETKKYKVKVNKYAVEEDVFKKAEEDYEIVKFYLLVENLTDVIIDSEDVNCIVDGIAQENYYYSGHSDLPFRINKGLTVKGTAKFIVPKNATSYDIKY